MDEPLAELAAYFRKRVAVPDQELTPADRRGPDGREPAGCHRRRLRRPGPQGHHRVISPAVREGTDTWAELLFGAAQCSLHKLTGSGSYFPPLRWDCPRLRAAGHRPRSGRPVHIEHGHAPGCPGLAAGQPPAMSGRLPMIPVSRLAACA